LAAYRANISISDSALNICKFRDTSEVMQTVQNPLITDTSHLLDDIQMGFQKWEQEVKLEHCVYAKGIRLSCLYLIYLII